MTRVNYVYQKTNKLILYKHTKTSIIILRQLMYEKTAKNTSKNSLKSKLVLLLINTYYSID